MNKDRWRLLESPSSERSYSSPESVLVSPPVPFFLVFFLSTFYFIFTELQVLFISLTYTLDTTFID